MDDLYALLGLDPSASPEQIRHAHRKLAVRRHRAGVLELQDELQRMNQAFELLSDPARRREYDAKRELGLVQSAEDDAERIRRDGQVRRRYAIEREEQVLRRSEAALAESAPLVDALAREHDQAELANIRSRRRRALAKRAVEAGVLVLLVILALFVAQRFGWVR